MSLVGGFRALSFPLSTSDFSQYLFIKQHSERVAGDQGEEATMQLKEREIVLANVPLYWEQAQLERLFSQFGEVEAVHLAQLGQHALSVCAHVCV